MLPPIKFEGHKVRVAADGQVSILDAMRAVGIKEVRHAWKRVQRDNPELVELATRVPFGRGTPTPVADEEGIYQILMALSTRYLDDEGRAMIQGFRAWLANTAARVRRADPTLAAEIIDRTEDLQDAKWLARRAQHKVSSLTLNGALLAHGATKKGYKLVHDTLNVSVTGCTAQQVRSIRRKSKRVTKDNFSEQELAAHTMLQYATTNALESSGAQGDGECITAALEVTADFKPVLEKYFGKRPFPPGGMLQTTF